MPCILILISKINPCVWNTTIATLLQRCCNVAATLPQRCCNVTATFLQRCCNATATFLQRCCNVTATFLLLSLLMRRLLLLRRTKRSWACGGHALDKALHFLPEEVERSSQQRWINIVNQKQLCMSRYMHTSVLQPPNLATCTPALQILKFSNCN